MEEVGECCCVLDREVLAKKERFVVWLGGLILVHAPPPIYEQLDSAHDALLVTITFSLLFCLLIIEFFC